MNSPTFNALAAIPVLAGVRTEAIALLDAEGIVRTFTGSEIIVKEGAEGHSFFILMEGDVEVIKHLDGPAPVLLARLHRGTFFGEMCVVDPVPRAATVRTISPVTALEIKAATLHHLFQKMPEQYAIVILNLARDMARRLRALDEAFAGRAS
jgi:CRP/FNR family cyclic AMP-dependent transcriptional regulator